LSERPKKPSRVRLMTDEDIERHFGSGFVLGPVVRPAKAEPAKEEPAKPDAQLDLEDKS
jgi:hypothetical protein